jgi:hypothetical protein
VSDAVGRFELDSPVLFAPGRNELRRGSDVFRFTGRARSVRAVPVTARPEGASLAVDIARFDEEGAHLQTSGAARIEFRELAAGGLYDVAVDGSLRRERAGARSLSVRVGPGEHRVELRRVRE